MKAKRARALVNRFETIQNSEREFSFEFPRERERERELSRVPFSFSGVERYTRRVVFCFSHLHFHLFVIIHGRHDCACKYVSRVRNLFE